MTSFNYMLAQIIAVWRMAANMPDWRKELDTSVDGVFRSFQAALYALPVNAALYILFWRNAGRFDDFPVSPLVAAGVVPFVVTQLFAFAIEWSASLVLLVMVARSIKVEHQIANMIVGYNWSQVIMSAVQLATVMIIGVTGTSTLGGAVAMPALVLQLAILWGVIRRAFGASSGSSIAIIVLLLLVGMTAVTITTSVALALVQVSP